MIQATYTVPAVLVSRAEIVRRSSGPRRYAVIMLKVEKQGPDLSVECRWPEAGKHSAEIRIDAASTPGDFNVFLLALLPDALPAEGVELAISFEGRDIVRFQASVPDMKDVHPIKRSVDATALEILSCLESRIAIARGEDRGCEAAWIREVLDTYNKLREQHGVAPLLWSSELAASARIAANEYADSGTICKPPKGISQSVFDGDHGSVSAPSVIETWYNESVDPGYQGLNTNTRNFTQIVWASTTHVGMNCDARGRGMLVVHYSPPGNQYGEFEKNVLPVVDNYAVSLKSEDCEIDPNKDKALSDTLPVPCEKAMVSNDPVPFSEASKAMLRIGVPVQVRHKFDGALNGELGIVRELRAEGTVSVLLESGHEQLIDCEHLVRMPPKVANLRLGTEVEICNHRQRPDLNGKHAVLVSEHSSRFRHAWAVKVAGSGESLLLGSASLRAIGDAQISKKVKSDLSHLSRRLSLC